VLALVSKMFSLAIKWGWRTDNPCRGVERFPEAKRARYLAPEELKRLTEALAAYPDDCAAKAKARGLLADGQARARMIGQRGADAVRLLLLTGARRGEVLGARWDQIDLERGVWSKPGSTTKQKTEHIAPLSAAAVTLLKQLKDRAPKGENGALASPFVFASGEGHMYELNDEWRAIREAAKLPDLRLHDLRHSFASLLASGGASLPMIGALLGHSNPNTTSRYAHLFSDPLRKLADEVGHVVTGTKPAEVVRLPKGGAA
jgi:integrase